jgi:hypothetical protein
VWACFEGVGVDGHQSRQKELQNLPITQHPDTPADVTHHYQSVCLGCQTPLPPCLLRLP